ncbi:MAG: amidohydrolase family protein [Zavarzinella sp.]
MLRFFVSVIFFLSSSQLIFAADQYYVIQNATVHVDSATNLLTATVVIKNDKIIAVQEKGIEIPPGATVIDGKGMHLYAGFTDLATTRGFSVEARKNMIAAESPPNTEESVLVATKADHAKGLTPEFETSQFLLHDEKEIAPWREVGITKQMTIPTGGFISGQACLTQLVEGTPRQALLQPKTAMVVSFSTIPGSDYPRALMGVFAHCRQKMYDALYYAEQSVGNNRPKFNPLLDALLPPLGMKQVVIFDADSRDEIERAVRFADEFRLRPIILGGKDAWKLAGFLAEKKIPVILRIPYPDKILEQPNLPERAAQQQKDELQETIAGYQKLVAKGVPVALSTDGISGEKTQNRWVENLQKLVKAGAEPKDVLQSLTQTPAQLLGLEKSYGQIAPGFTADLVLMDGKWFEKDHKVRGVFVGGNYTEYEVSDDKKPEPRKKDPVEPKKEEPKKEVKETKQLPTELDVDRTPKIKTGGNVIIRNATVLTAAKPATLKNVDIFVQKGKIVDIAPTSNKTVAGATVIDAKGMFVMPGIIDTHAHFSIAGGVNEFSLSVVPEVRVKDVINSDEIAIYRSLAGGVTAARLLHGSANVIGGQDAVIKLKYQRSANELLIEDAPQGVKFALGENVKRSEGRFPNTRLGVEAVLVRAFTEAQQYQQQWKDYEDAKGRLPKPRKDLRLEALSDILEGKIKVHCHCYRSDEIIMLLRVADRFGIKIQSLQHVLEGYKVAPEIAEHGASCSLFSDWWAYKIEAFDAIPFATAMLHRAGVDVCLKSDSSELVRHMYQEAAKLIKYGSMTEEEALKTITYNAAKQLGLEKRIGSIEVGKDADLAIFNGHPLNGFSRCEMTLVEGEVYFQNAEKLVPFAPAAISPTKPTLAKFPELPKSGSYLLKNVELHNPGAKPITTDVRIVAGKIDEIGTKLPQNNATVLEAKGYRLYPGMIDAGTIIGLTEIGSAKETQDFAESGDFQPDIQAATGINPDSEIIPVTRANGVLTVVTRPAGPVVSGQAALINLEGWVPKEMVVEGRLALHIDYPSEFSFPMSDPSTPSVGMAVAKKIRQEKIRKLKALFAAAKRYQSARQADQKYPTDPQLEAMLPYITGQKPVIVTADRENDIREALALAKEMPFKMILSGGTDAWKVADELKKQDVPVIIGPVMTLPRRPYDPFDAPYANAAKLHKAGVMFCIRSSGGTNTRNLPYETAMAVSYGLPPEVALQAITINPATILGVADRLGSIETGKMANLVLTNGDILQPSTQVIGLFINGKPLPPTSKHTELYEKYTRRLEEYLNQKNR